MKKIAFMVITMTAGIQGKSNTYSTVKPNTALENIMYMNYKLPGGDYGYPGYEQNCNTTADCYKVTDNNTNKNYSNVCVTGDSYSNYVKQVDPGFGKYRFDTTKNYCIGAVFPGAVIL